MKTKLQLFLFLIVVLFSTSTYGQVIEEYFDYTSGELGGQGTVINGWGGAWQKNTGLIEIIDGNLGNDIIGKTLQTQKGTIGANYTRELATKWIDDAKDVWISFYMKRKPTTTFRWGGFSLYNGSSEDLFIGSPWQSGFVGLGTGVATVQDTLLNYLLVKLEMNGTSTPDSAFFWVNYFKSSEPNKASAEEKRAWGTDGFTKIRIANDTNYTISYDKIRIANTFVANIVNNSVTGISLNVNQLNLKVGDESSLIATISPYNATNRALTFTSNAKSVASVSSTGMVTALSGGTAIITVTTADGAKKATCTVKVIQTIDNTIYNSTISATDLQTIKGWGNCPIWIDNHDISTKPLAQQVAFNMGATIIRLSQLPNTGDGDGKIKTIGADKLCRAIQVTAENKLPYLLVSWSPPAEMKTIEVNGSLSDNKLVYLREDKEQTYCDFVVQLLNYISVTKKLPLPLAYSFQNEPLNQTIWQGCIYGAAQYQRVFKLMRATLDKAGYANILLLGPENGYDGTVFLGGTGFPSLKDDAYNKAISAFSTHSYIWESMNINYNQWINGFTTWGKDIWQTEYCYIDGGTSKNSVAVGTTRRLIADMLYFKNNYWFTWTVNDGYGNKDSDALCFGDGVTNITRKPEYYVLKKIFSNVPVGSKVRKITSTDKSLITINAIRMDMVAFASDTNMVVVITNPTEMAKTTNMNGLTGTSAKIFQMATDKDNTDMALIGTSDISAGTISTINLPANSVTIITASNTISGVNELKTNQNLLKIYPNPAIDHITIQAKQSKTANYNLSINNISGQTVLTQKINFEGNFNLDITNIENGLYLLNLENTEEQMFQKFVIQR